MGRNLFYLVASAWIFTGCAPEGPSAFVDFNIPPDSECRVTPGGGETVIFLPMGLYDIAADGNPDQTNAGACANPYLLNLRVNSQLRTGFDTELGRAEPNVLQITQAEVKLMNQRQQTLAFDDVENPLPNPFLVNTNLSLPPTDTEEPSLGIAVVKAIPTAYAPFLDEFVGDEILIEVKLFGSTLGDVDVDFQPYLYPVRICNGCLTECASQIDLEELEDSDMCIDNAGYDNRVCVDGTC